MRKERDILYETPHFWVSWSKFKDRKAAFVWRPAGTHSVCVATVDLRDRARSVARAIAEADKRELELAYKKV